MSSYCFQNKVWILYKYMYLSKVTIIKKKTCHSEDVFSGNCGSVLIDLSLYFVGYENDLIIYLWFCKTLLWRILYVYPEHCIIGV